MVENKIKFYYEDGAEKYKLMKSSKGASGIDIRSQESIRVQGGERVIVSTKLHVKIPASLEIQIRPRSGLAAKFGLTVLNSPGTIDSDYLGEIKVILYNSSKTVYYIQKGDKIAQMVVQKVLTKNQLFEEVENFKQLGDSERGEKGFGSTGIK